MSETIEVTFFDRDRGRGVYGARRMWHQLRRDGVAGRTGRPVARCTVERLIRHLGLRGVRRGQPVITTRPDTRAGRAPDLVDRDFTATRPNQLWVVDMSFRSALWRWRCGPDNAQDRPPTAGWTG